MKKILILGHKGMLGNAVYKYFSKKNSDYTVLITETRWGGDIFKTTLQNTDADFIINCIGIIPQKKPDLLLYENINIDLPIFLETLQKKIIHPSTDCEFLGNLPLPEKYTKKSKRDASDPYGKSKAIISEQIETSFKNTKIIRTSIIGHEENTSLSLLDWFISSESDVTGYENHYWNGVTTLEWAKICENIINNWNLSPTLNQYGTEEVKNKNELLQIIKRVYKKNITIIPFKTSTTINKTLYSDIKLPPIEKQLKELKSFYNK